MALAGRLLARVEDVVVEHVVEVFVAAGMVLGLTTLPDVVLALLE